ncbi:MAG: hypothetical protein CL578_06060 [Alteromonadaceae bacterium]|uniref:Type II secretion system protein GspF domain-containing protein n=1 Tax=Paraglaciecola agarilytica NO2 TaxID=1125747 RepID=A0ABQ0I2A4_9ALTE|nr:hypothetical protein [Paraglaciecola agarilytica]MBN24597.1 hypothetical protein [Alteromonadaceae bacterium]GAC03445.1 hypothetical protein GAGA_0580 [Paraglaciecola agarilytica NO2]
MSPIISRYLDDVRFIIDRLYSKVVALSDIRYLYLRFVFNRSKQFKFIEDYASFLETTSDAYACQSIIDGVDLSNDAPIKKNVANSILDALNDGKKASFGMEKWFDGDILDLYKAGEKSGDIKKVLDIFLEQETSLREFKNQFLGKFLAPGYILFSGIGFAIYLGKSDFMGFANFTPVSKWSDISQFCYSLSIFLADYYISIFLAMLFLIVTWKQVAFNAIGKHRAILDRCPPFSIFKAYQSLSILKLIAIIKATKASDQKAILVAHANSNKYVQSFTSVMLNSLDLGETQLARVLDVGLFPARLMSRLYSVSRIPDDQSKNRALLIVTKQAESEAKLHLSKTQFWLMVMSWLLAVAITGITVIGFALVILNLKTFITTN